MPASHDKGGRGCAAAGVSNAYTAPKSVFRRKNDAGGKTSYAAAAEMGLPARKPRRSGNLRRAHRWRAPSRRRRDSPRNRAELTPVSLRPPRQRRIVLPCPLGNDGEVWSSRRQRTRDGAHRLRGPSKADAQSSLHQPQPQSGPHGQRVGKP